MKLNSFNTYNLAQQTNKHKNSNQNFGATINSKRALREILQYTNHEKMAQIVKDILKTGCKNSVVTSDYVPCLRRGEQLILSFRKFNRYNIKLGLIEEFTGNKLKTEILNGQQVLLDKIMGDAAVNGKLDTVKRKLLKQLPELTEDINTRYQTLQEASDLAKITPNNDTNSLFVRFLNSIEDFVDNF